MKLSSEEVVPSPRSIHIQCVSGALFSSTASLNISTDNLKKPSITPRSHIHMRNSMTPNPSLSLRANKSQRTEALVMTPGVTPPTMEKLQINRHRHLSDGRSKMLEWTPIHRSGEDPMGSAIPPIWVGQTSSPPPWWQSFEKLVRERGSERGNLFGI